nr:gliding motility-associated C-terminal domain-containing protein [uncultured Flavobacterium sp.]
MRKNIVVIILFFLNYLNAQQNLVLNPSFEDVGTDFTCNPFSTPLPNLFAQNWRSATGATPDIFHSNFPVNCFLNTFGGWSNQVPRTGNAYAGIANHYVPNNFYREYLRGKLSQPLVVGETYVINFYACLGIYSSDGSNNLGVKFIEGATAPYLYQGSILIPFQPDVNYSGPPFTSLDTWTLFSFIFTPSQSNLDEFIIGNFFDDESTLRQNLQSAITPNSTYFLIDDVEVFSISVDFDDFESICAGEELILPSISNNNVEGTWSPAVNNQETTTYTFTPNNPLFQTIEKTVVVNPIIEPTFDLIGPFCDETPNITELPTISNNGIQGSWSPAFDPNKTTTYMFIPNEEFCAEIVIMKVIIDKTPSFDPIEPFCEVNLNFRLPTVSTNGISGVWSPEFDPYNSQTYTFTKDSEYCTRQVTLDVIVYPQLKFELFSYCMDGTYFIEFKANNFSLSEMKNVQWLINNSSISETDSKINLSKYLNLLQAVNVIEIIFTDSNGCLHTKEIKVLGEFICKIQKGISPNGDGLNEYFDLVSFGGVDLKIFNRYGSLVYEKSNYTNEWKGQSNSGNQLPTGTYFYQIQTKIGEQFTDYIQLTY